MRESLLQFYVIYEIKVKLFFDLLNIFMKRFSHFHYILCIPVFRNDHFAG